MPTANELLNKHKNRFKTENSNKSNKSVSRSYKRPWQEHISEEKVDDSKSEHSQIESKSKISDEPPKLPPIKTEKDLSSKTEKNINIGSKASEDQILNKKPSQEEIQLKKSDVYCTKNLSLYKKILSLTSPDRGFMYLMLREISDDNGLIRFSLKDLQESLNMNEQTIRRNLRGLKEMDLITELDSWDAKSKLPTQYKVNELTI